jgi:GTP-binding protein
MKFIDEVEIEVVAGHGGHGAVSFRREKHAEYGGPDGGDGGHGGNVILEADTGVNTLVHFRGRKVYEAEDGQKGIGTQSNGRSGEDLIIKVPVGTLVYNRENDQLMCDLDADKKQFQIARGGRGGLGNMNFKTSTNQAPRFAQEGKPGQSFLLKLELKLIADIALVGMPNAGKSTLISVISSAKPKIADYPFTTLEPNLGVVKFHDSAFVVADIPGLIEHAAQGKGLGIKFLKHIERTKALVHLIDCSMFLEPFEAIEAYMIIRNELLQFSESVAWKKELVCITKIDAMTEEEIQKFITALEEHTDKKVLPISAVSGRNIDKVKELMFELKMQGEE